MSDRREGTFNPYPGLRPFREDESHLFFGRSQQIDELLAELDVSRFVAVMGASGSGKSSLVAAGLFPALHGGLAPRMGSRWRVATMRPGANPMRNLALSLSAPAALGYEGDDPILASARIEATLRRSGLGLADVADNSGSLAESRLLVVADQFEELFRFAAAGLGDAADGSAFVQLLIEASRSDAPVEVIITMRSDFLGDCARFRDLPETINKGLYLVPRLTRSQLREAITAPAAVGGAVLAPRLVQRVLNDAGTDPDTLPLVQHALMRTWDLWEQRGITDVPIDLDLYEAAGGVEEALSRHADEAFGELRDDSMRRIAEIMFKRLTELGRDGREVRRPSPIVEIQAVTESSRDEIGEVIDVFGRPGRSFVTMSPDDVVDISHESLIRQWGRLRRWAREEARSRDEYTRLADAARRWEAGEAALLRNPGLEVASTWWESTKPNKTWADRYDPAFESAAGYLEQSRRSVERRRLVGLGGVVGLGVLAVLFALLAVRATRAEADASRQEAAAVARLLAGVSVDLGADDREIGILTALEALNATTDQGLRVPDAEEALRALMAEPLGSPLPAVPGQARHRGGVNAVDVSDDGRWLASGADDGTLLLWDTENIETGPLRLTGHGDRVTNAIFSRDGRLLATGDGSGLVLVWDMRSPPSEPERFGPHTGSIEDLAFSPDGNWLASGAEEPTAWLHPLDGSGAESRPLPHGGFVLDLEFSSDGSQLLTGSGDGKARLWHVDDSNPVVDEIHQGDPDVVSVAFAPSDQQMVIGTRDGVIRGISPGGVEQFEVAHPGGLVTFGVSGDGRWLASGGGDGTARLWDLQNPAGAAVAGRVLPVRGVIDEISFDSGSRWLAIGGEDDAARLYDMSNLGAEPVILAGPVRALGLQEGVLAVGSSEGSVRAWDIDDLSTRPRILAHRDENGAATGVLSLAFSPDGSELATGTEEHALWQWSVAADDSDPTVQEIRRAAGFPDAGLTAVTYTSDGRRLVTGSGDHMVWIDDLDRADEEPVPIQFDGEIGSLTVSPDGRWLAVGVRDEGAVLVDISTVEMPQIPLRYHTDDVTDMAFSPDGRGLAVASQDTKVSIWDPEDPEAPMAVLEEHTKVASSVSFSGDSRWLATGSWDGTVLIWDTNDLSASAMTLGPAGRVEDVALRHDGAVLASAGGGAVLLWDLTTGDPTDQVANPTVLTAGPRSASRITFSPDGRWLATAGSGGDVGLWMQLDDLMESACHSVGRNLTLEEWQSLMPGEPYHETCEQWPDGG